MVAGNYGSKANWPDVARQIGADLWIDGQAARSPDEAARAAGAG